MASSGTAIDAKLMLHAEYVHVIEVEIVRRSAIGVEILLLQLKFDPLRIVVALNAVTDRRHQTLGLVRHASYRFA